MNELITDPNKPVQGVALYAEFTCPAYGDLYQMFFTPDGTDEAGHFVVASLFRRRLTKDTPRKQWRVSKMRSQLAVEGTSPEEVRLWRLDSVRDTLTRLQSRYELVGTPFFVEVSKKDLTEIGKGKTPIKVVYRVGQTRTALGYPELIEK